MMNLKIGSNLVVLFFSMSKWSSFSNLNILEVHRWFCSLCFSFLLLFLLSENLVSLSLSMNHVKKSKTRDRDQVGFAGKSERSVASFIYVSVLWIFSRQLRSVIVQKIAIYFIAQLALVSVEHMTKLKRYSN